MQFHYVPEEVFPSLLAIIQHYASTNTVHSIILQLLH